MKNEKLYETLIQLGKTGLEVFELTGMIEKFTKEKCYDVGFIHGMLAVTKTCKINFDEKEFMEYLKHVTVCQNPNCEIHKTEGVTLQ